MLSVSVVSPPPGSSPVKRINYNEDYEDYDHDYKDDYKNEDYEDDIDDALMTTMVGGKPGKARGSLRDFSVEEFPNESGSEENRSGSDTPKLQNLKYKNEL